MIRIEPNCIYSHEELDAMWQQSGSSWTGLKTRNASLRNLPTLGRAGILGSVLLQALEHLALSELQLPKRPAPAVGLPGKRKRGRPSKLEKMLRTEV